MIHVMRGDSISTETYRGCSISTETYHGVQYRQKHIMVFNIDRNISWCSISTETYHGVQYQQKHIVGVQYRQKHICWLISKIVMFFGARHL